LGGDVFCRRPSGATAPQWLSCADFAVFSEDDFWKHVGHLYTLSDQVDWLPLSRAHACLFHAHRYTTFAMASLDKLKELGLGVNIKKIEQVSVVPEFFKEI